MADRTLRYRIEFDDANAIRATTRTQRAVDHIGKVAAQAGTTASRGLHKLIDTIQRINSSATPGFQKFATGVRDFVQNPLAGAASMAESFILKLGPVGTGLMAAGAAFGVAAKAALNLVATFGKVAETELLMADRTGMTVGEVRQLAAAGKIAGVEIGGLVSGMRLMSEALSQNSEEGERGKKVLKELGISAFDANRELRPIGQLIFEIGSAISKLPTVPEQQRAITRLFGRGGAELLPLFKQLPELRRELMRLGIGIDDGLTRELARADDAMDKVGLAWDELKRKLAGEIVATVRVIAPSLLGQSGPGKFSHPSATAARAMAGNALYTMPGPTPPGQAYARGLQAGTHAGMRDTAWTKYLDAQQGELAIKRKLQKAEAELKVAETDRDISAHSRAVERINDLNKQLDALNALKEAQKAVQEFSSDGHRRFRENKQAELWKQSRQKFSDTSLALIEMDTALAKERGDYDKETREIAQRTQDSILDYRQTTLKQSMDTELRALETIGAETVSAKVYVEKRRGEIEIDYLNKEAALHVEAIARRKERETEYLNWLKTVQPAMAAEIDARISAVGFQAAEESRQAEQTWQAQTIAARENAANRSAEIIREHNQQVFDSFKRSAEGVFDALLVRGQGVFQALGNAFKTAILTAIKEIVTSNVAVALARMFSGASVSGRGGLGGILSAAPALAGIGGTPGVAGGAAGAGSTGGGAGSLAGFAGMGAGLKDFLGMGGSIQTGAGTATTWGAATMGQKLSALGKSNAALFGGAMLAYSGLRRGGLSGLGMTTAGGAMIGFKFGGPLGAAIGAGIGALAGIGRLFVKSPDEKMREKIRAAYGLDVKDKGVLGQLVDLAKSRYGNNYDLTIRSSEAQEILELYAQMTGQNFAGKPKVAPVGLLQTGGSLYQAPTLNNGSPSGIGGGLRPIGGSLDRIGVASGAVNLTIQLDGKATTDVMEGKAVNVVVNNPRLIQASTQRASRSNFGRREAAALAMSPSTILA